MNIPKTHQERAADLKAAGAGVHALNRRGLYRITCPKCGGTMTTRHAFYALTDAERSAMEKHGGGIALVDERKPNVVKAMLGGGKPGGPIAAQPDTYVESGDVAWYRARGHVLTCTGLEPLESFRVSQIRKAGDNAAAVTLVHSLRRLIVEHPELRDVVLTELSRCGLLEVVREDDGRGLEGTAMDGERGRG